MAGSCIFRLAPYALIWRWLRTLKFNVFFEIGRFRLPWLVEKKSYSIRRKVIQSIGRAPQEIEMLHQSSDHEGVAHSLPPKTSGTNGRSMCAEIPLQELGEKKGSGSGSPQPSRSTRAVTNAG